MKTEYQTHSVCTQTSKYSHIPKNYVQSWKKQKTKTNNRSCAFTHNMHACTYLISIAYLQCIFVFHSAPQVFENICTVHKNKRVRREACCLDLAMSRTVRMTIYLFFVSWKLYHHFWKPHILILIVIKSTQEPTNLLLTTYACLP